MQNTVVIVGAGFCGTVLAANLQLAARIASPRRSGKLQVNAGRIDSVIAAGEQLRVSWRPRCGGSATLTVDLVVNATGPDYVLKRGAVPLLNSLRAAGLESEDALELGLRTARYGACVDAQGLTNQDLYYPRTHIARRALGGDGRDRAARSRRAARGASRRSPRGVGCTLTPAALVRSASGSTHRECCTWRCRCGAGRRARRDPTLAPAALRRNLRPKRKCLGFPAP
jgi:hypothetical protein